MPIDQGPMGFPLKPHMPGTPALQAMSEAQDLQDRHDKWHCDNPGNWNCPPELSSPTAYEDIERGQALLDPGAMTIEPGDSFLFGRK